jgi:flagellar motor component MotA
VGLVLGFALFLCGFFLTGSGVVPFWAAFLLAVGGIFLASGIVPLPTRAKARSAEL